MSEAAKVHDVIVIGAGVGGICQIKHLIDHGFDALVLEASSGLGGTWYNNRYPGCRFDSESYTYGYRFSDEVLQEWHWKERFSPQPENLKYLNFVADKFDLRPHIKCNAFVQKMAWQEDDRTWLITLKSGETFQSRFVVTCVGALSAPVYPNLEGMEDFAGESFHTFDWPHEPLDLSNKRVGIIGTGATGIQIIAELADKVRELFVFQRRPNWSVPLNNSKISDAEMADIRARYKEIFEMCDLTNGGFEHLPDRRGYDAVSLEDRIALWDKLYDTPGFAMLTANFPETFLDAEANRALSDYVADRIRQRVKDPETAEKLIPKDHGFGMRRLPLETNYFEAYNRDTTHLVDLTETPIERVTSSGLRTTEQDYELDVLIYATGFDPMLGAFNRMDVQGTDGRTLGSEWENETRTYLGVFKAGFPNLLMVGGPQSVSGSTNYPPAIENGVEWVMRFLLHARETGRTRFEACEDGEVWWTDIVKHAQERMPFSKVKSWFTGYTSNAKGGPEFRYNAFWAGAPKYRSYLKQAEDEGYAQVVMK